MGTSSSNKKKSIKNNELSLYEKIPIVTGDFDIIIYKLIWQKRPKILGFEIITSELITKDTNLNFDFKSTKLKLMGNILWNWIMEIE